ncbi:MAG: fluoride efflux transporter FluC [Acidimicrobiales bacterium]
MATARHPLHIRFVVAVAVGGALGALGRYGVAHAWPVTAGAFPWSTFVVNLSGSALLGCVVTVVLARPPHARWARPLLGSGVIGAYTTFSTFAVEIVQLGRHGHVPVAAVYAVASMACGIAAVLGAAGVTRAVLTAVSVQPGPPISGWPVDVEDADADEGDAEGLGA